MNGKIIGLSNEEYHANRTHVSKSSLDKLAKSPAAFKWSLDNKEEPTLAMEIGTMTHCFILEPSEFENRYAVQPKFDGRTKDGKAAKEQWARENAGKKPITDEYAELLSNMKRSIYAHKAAGKLLASEGDAEVSIFGNLLDVPCKCRFDWLTKDGIAVDLKTTEDASMAGFSKSCFQYSYHKQVAFYKAVAASVGIEIKQFIFLAVEKSGPWQVATYELDTEAELLGQVTYENNLNLLKECRALDSWPAYGHKIEKLSLPRWATSKGAE